MAGGIRHRYQHSPAEESIGWRSNSVATGHRKSLVLPGGTGTTPRPPAPPPSGEFAGWRRMSGSGAEQSERQPIHWRPGPACDGHTTHGFTSSSFPTMRCNHGQEYNRKQRGYETAASADRECLGWSRLPVGAATEVGGSRERRLPATTMAGMPGDNESGLYGSRGSSIYFCVPRYGLAMR